jgi:hypothetical protein
LILNINDISIGSSTQLTGKTTHPLSYVPFSVI